MLIGEYIHTIDAKKRLSLPSKFRKEIGKTVVVTRGLDSCLFMFPMSGWEKIAGKLAEFSVGQSGTRGIGRFLLSGAVEAEVDSAGRILLPEYLTEFAGLSGKVVLAGMLERVEIWDEKKWRDYTKHMEKEADTLAEKLGDLGVL
jgi:MraZ protein